MSTIHVPECKIWHKVIQFQDNYTKNFNLALMLTHMSVLNFAYKFSAVVKRKQKTSGSRWVMNFLTHPVSTELKVSHLPR